MVIHHDVVDYDLPEYLSDVIILRSLRINGGRSEFS